jgi:hypothetical protein
MKRLLALLILAALAHAEYYPVYSSSYSYARENRTVYTFRTFNSYDEPTSAYRLWISSNFTWFYPPNFTYDAQPDFKDDDSAYWDMPPILPNETAEVSFEVNRLVGLPEEIRVRTEPLNKWKPECQHFRPLNGTANSFFLVQDYLVRTNRSQNVTAYYEDGGLMLVFLEGYGAFAVFSVNGTDARPVSDAGRIGGLADAYALAAAPVPEGNVSALHDAIISTKGLKYKAEHECYMLTGMDRNPCVDRESCLYSCFSVPVCSLVGQSGWDFMDTILDYNRSVTEANALLENASASSDALVKSPDYYSAVKAYDDLVALNRAESRVIFHPLINSYGFCEPPHYGLMGQTDARRELLDYIGSTCMAGAADEIKSDAEHVAPLLLPKPEANFTDAGAGGPENISIEVGTGFAPPAPADEQGACCAFGICSVFGIERIGGVCWEWAALGLLGVALVLFIASEAMMAQRKEGAVIPKPGQKQKPMKRRKGGVLNP